MDDKELIKLIKNKRFSKLSFLEDKDLLKENEYYYGFLYFTLDAREESNEELLSEIVQIKGSLSSAYEYLGTVAKKLFYEFDESYVSASFFRLSIMHDKDNTNAWWELFCVERNPRLLLESLKIDYKNKSFEDISHKIGRARYIFSDNADFTENEWELFFEILIDDRLKRGESITSFLIVVYYHLNRYEDGVKLIKELDNVDVDIIKKYRDLGKIDNELAISKVYDFELDKLIKKDYERIYEEYIKRNTKDKRRITKLGLVSKAFEAKRYNDVIAIYQEKWEDDQFSQHEVGLRLYYLISQLYLNEPLDEKVYDFVLKKASSDILFKFLECKKIIFDLKGRLKVNDKIDFPLAIWRDYQNIEKILEDPDVINHYLYVEIYDELTSLEEEWDKSYFKNKLNSIKSELESKEFSFGNFESFCHYGIENGHYVEVFDRVVDFHNDNIPTITTQNVLGVCCERRGMYQEAFQYYEKAIKIMEDHNDFSYIVISNYLNASKLSGNELSKKVYDHWRDMFNISLVNSFKWDRFLTSGKGSLYKYSPFNLNTLDSLINQYFYLPKKNQLNDPIEMPAISKIGSEHLIDSDYRVCSFSKNQNSMLMWSHYTENHQGIMVEYQFGSGIPNACGIGSVKYTNGEKRKIEQDQYIFNQYLLTKNKEWSYEEEVRLISYKLDKVYYSSYEYPNPDRSKLNARIASITLGCNFPPSKLQLITNLVASMNEKRTEYETKIKLKQARISENNMFGLEYVPIEI
ncbi:DUF2971 domain-containing protein [Vibrio parahaemolyticus]|nr:DUF2971 domain-containing protein [Vibrio parahaemolyticus]ELA7518960.1 DUF2971 domain-containing protein [Vibrio parahaemolyticus]ELC0681483.1 DUF2971 domain-containing protein [Vibrio parahaemolyticus]